MSATAAKRTVVGDNSTSQEAQDYIHNFPITSGARAPAVNRSRAELVVPSMGWMSCDLSCASQRPFLQPAIPLLVHSQKFKEKRKETRSRSLIRCPPEITHLPSPVRIPTLQDGNPRIRLAGATEQEKGCRSSPGCLATEDKYPKPGDALCPQSKRLQAENKLLKDALADLRNSIH
ncbi:hypothetical protein FNYG_05143 [Fusarium nygamai]|uniref:Uncharacterized protein n=1 Tax=Gibberella nygamai TaxID=42673 RepID=A0A2K0WGQ6_GIBNY|nr:hypothetical protein FNYG_05143 [Fusarium nygamai]